MTSQRKSGELEFPFLYQYPQYLEMSDDDILKRAQNGEKEAVEFLLFKYRNLVPHQVKSYFLIGAEREDLVQVGMIGLWQAIMNFRKEKAKSFVQFAKTCIQRQILTAVKSATRQKRILLNLAQSLKAEHYKEPTSKESHPEQILINREINNLFQERLKNSLSELEWEVFSRYREGKSYKEIAEELNCKTKSIDCALTRVKRKVAQLIAKEELR